MKSDKEPRAPIGACFASVEGESSRIGERTAFFHVANGVYQTPTELLARPGSARAIESSERVVLDVCEVGLHFDWLPFAEAFAKLVASRSPTAMVLETRGERHIGDRVEGAQVYLNLTPGYTVLRPEGVSRPTEVKLLLNSPDELERGVELLRPWLDEGCACFLFPRVREARHAAPFFQKFLQLPLYAGLRMMLVEHEVVGIE